MRNLSSIVIFLGRLNDVRILIYHIHTQIDKCTSQSNRQSTDQTQVQKTLNRLVVVCRLSELVNQLSYRTHSYRTLLYRTDYNLSNQSIDRVVHLKKSNHTISSKQSEFCNHIRIIELYVYLDTGNTEWWCRMSIQLFFNFPPHTGKQLRSVINKNKSTQLNFTIAN